MTRGISGATLTELSKDNLTMISLVAIPNLGGGQYTTDGPIDISYNGNTYVSMKGHMSISEIVEGENVNIEKLTIMLSAVPSEAVKLVLDNDFINKQVLVYHALMNNDYSIIGTPILLFDGRAEAPAIVEDFKNRTATISLSVTNHWSDFQTGRGRRTNNNDQQSYFPGDEFFKYAKDVEKDIKWGRE